MFVRKLNNKNILTNEIHKTIYPSGSAASRIYGLPRMHKRAENSTLPLQPIILSIGSFNYNLEKYLNSLITTNISHQYCLSDSFTVLEEIRPQDVPDKILVFVDITSPFTDIPLDETIDLDVNTILRNKILQN